jgi:hypothetical protein
MDSPAISLRGIRGGLVAAILLAPALAGGCMVQAQGVDGRVPLRIISDGPVGQAVGVSMITSTPPVNFLLAWHGMYKDLKTDWAISVESIDFIDPSKPELAVQKFAQVMVLFMTQWKIQCFAVFAPGCEPGVAGEQMFRGSLSVETDSDAYNAVTVREVRWTIRRSDAPGGAGPAAPNGDDMGYILSKGQFWDSLRWSYAGGDKRAEIKTICRCVAQAADARQMAHPDTTWSAAQQKSLAWCRSVVARAD